MKYILLIALCGVLSGCATTPPEPVIKTVEVKVAVPVPCPALIALGEEPNYVDSEASIAAEQSLGELAKLYVIGRYQRTQRLAEYSAAALACKF